MPTRRMIEPAIWQSESMGRLTIRQRLMFIGMFSNADDQGRLRASAPVIRSMIFPFDDITIDDIENDIKAIESEGCVLLYGQNGSRFAQLINWWIYQQHQWAYPSKIPKADGWSDRLRFRQGGQVITENWDTKRPSIDQNRIEVPKAIGKGLGKEKGKGKAKATPKGEAAKPPTPPQISAFREVMHRYPEKALYQTIVDAVPESDIDFYSQVLRAWLGTGWNKFNIDGQLDCYKRREIPHKNGHNGNGSGSVSPMMQAILDDEAAH
jgi:hypothetical protein